MYTKKIYTKIFTFDNLCGIIYKNYFGEFDMLPTISLIGIVSGLVLLIFLAYKGHSIIWVAPVCAALVAVVGGLNVLQSYLEEYIGELRHI